VPIDPELDAALAAAKEFTPDLVERWSRAVDAEMVAALEALDLKAMPVRKRIRTAVLTRLAILKPHKQIARRAALFLASPLQMPLGLRLVAATADAMWRAARDTSTDFNWYTKRTILAAVYTATEIAWFGDDTPDESATARFLDARIENVIQYEKLKTRVRAACQPIRTA
jgi:ubiquinone biosynthesis protein COQ9